MATNADLRRINPIARGLLTRFTSRGDLDGYTPPTRIGAQEAAQMRAYQQSGANPLGLTTGGGQASGGLLGAPNAQPKAGYTSQQIQAALARMDPARASMLINQGLMAGKGHAGVDPYRSVNFSGFGFGGQQQPMQQPNPMQMAGGSFMPPMPQSGGYTQQPGVSWGNAPRPGNYVPPMTFWYGGG